MYKVKIFYTWNWEKCKGVFISKEKHFFIIFTVRFYKLTETMIKLPPKIILKSGLCYILHSVCKCYT